MSVLVCAHRGASGYAPENTMKAFRLAHEMGADAVENDVHLTADGNIVIIHDESVSRTSNGTGITEQMTLAELKALDFGAGEKIPTLDECLSFIKESGMLLNIEIKTCEKDYNPAIIKGVSDAIKRHSVENNIIISSFYHKSLIDFKAVNSSIPTAVLHGKELENPGAYARSIGASFSHPHFECVDGAFMRECAVNGILVNPWTVNNNLDMRRMAFLGVNMIITNYPDICRAETSGS